MTNSNSREAEEVAIGVVIVATSAVRRAGLESMLSHTPEIKPLRSFGSIPAFQRQFSELRADIVLADLDENYSFEWSTRGAQSAEAGPPYVLLSDKLTPQALAEIWSSPVQAVLPRDLADSELALAIRSVHRGLSVTSKETMREILAHLPREPAISVEGIDHLTPREREVLRMLAEGMSNREMAVRLGVTSNTVKFHVSSILDKLDAESRTEAVTIGIRSGLILL